MPAPAPAPTPTIPRMQGGAAPPPPFTMKGGARILPDGTLNAPDVLLAIILIVAIAQAHQIPSDVSRFTDTILGRMLLFATAIAMTAWKGWVIGLLTALLALRLLMHSDRAAADVEERFSSQVRESFQNQSIKVVTKNDKDENKHRWFVEKVFDEQPAWIETDKVQTQAVTGN
jgi:hypothetical protein